MDLIQQIEKEIMPVNREINFEIGDNVRVHYRIVEGDRERVQVFEGTVIAIDNKGISKTFTVRKLSFDVGVERIFPVHTPRIAKIEVVRKNKARRAKLYYLRDRRGKAAKLKERRFVSASKKAEKNKPVSAGAVSQGKSEDSAASEE